MGEGEGVYKGKDVVCIGDNLKAALEGLTGGRSNYNPYSIVSIVVSVLDATSLCNAKEIQRARTSQLTKEDGVT